MTAYRSNVVPIRPDQGDDELAKRLSESIDVQRRFFIQYGLAVVPTRGKAPGLARWVQMAVEAWAKVRFGIAGVGRA
jgi:hypothetical protein